MRVIVLNDYGYINGGASQVAINSLNGLAEAGMDVTFVSSVGPVDPSIDRNLVKVINFGFHDLLGNPSRMEASVRGIWDSRCAAQLRQILAGYDPNDTIIHLHAWVQSLSSSVVQAATSLGFKIVCTLHDYFSICPTGGLYNFSQKKLCLLEPMSLRCIASNCDSRSYAQKLWRVGRHAAQTHLGGIPSSLKYFITVSDYSESLMRPFMPADARFFRIGNPIGVEKAPPTDIARNRAFAYIGRISLPKGAAVFAEAAQIAAIAAVYAGSGPAEAQVAAINPSAKLLGWRDRAAVTQTIQSSRAIVFPSLVRETQGLAVLEAAALGVPAIVSDTCAAREAIVDGETGLLFRAGDAADLSSRLTRLNNDPGFSQHLGNQAYQRYWADPSTPEIHLKKLLACYQEVLHSADAPASM
jgi:glycosyltransferase involved in cell wall biosynthesis